MSVLPTAGATATRGHQPGRQRALGVLAVVAVLLLAGTAADFFAAAEPALPPPPVEQGAAGAGSWYCPSVAGDGETGQLTIAAVGEQPSTVIVERYGQGRADADEPRTVEPGAALTVGLEDKDAAAPSAVRWTGGAAAVSWRVQGDRTASAPCEPAPAERWHVVGFDTNLGLTSTLHLFNPFTSDAVVRLVFATLEGGERLVLADNILVGAGSTRSLNMRRYKPEVADLGVTVEVLSGRVVAQGEQTIVPPPRTKGAAGRLLLSAAPVAAENWYFGFAGDGNGAESWLSVLNPGDDVAAAEVRVSNPSGDASSLLGEVSVPPGGVARVELAGASKDYGFGVAVNVVNGQPVVVSRSSSLRTDGRDGVSGGLGTPILSSTWALVGGSTRSSAGLVNLYNPGPEPATATLTAPGAPQAWEAIQLPPNGHASVELLAAGEDRRTLPVLVRADVPIVAELRSFATGGDELGLDLDVGVPQEVWLGPPSRPPVRRNSSLTTTVGRVAPSEPDLFSDLEDLPAAPVEDAS